MTDETQPVATDANAAPEAPAADTGAQTDDLGSFLREWEAKAQTPPQPTPAAQPQTPDVAVLAERLARIEQERAIQKDMADEAEAIKRIKGDLDVEDWAVQGWLLSQVRNDQTINRIWANRDVSKADADRLVAKLEREFKKVQAAKAKSQVDQNATEDKAAVTAALRGGSAKAPEEAPKNYGAMDNNSLRQEFAKMGIMPNF